MIEIIRSGLTGASERLSLSPSVRRVFWIKRLKANRSAVKHLLTHSVRLRPSEFITC